MTAASAEPLVLPPVGRLPVLVGHRRVTAADGNALTQPERIALADVTAEVRRRSGAARIVARDLLVRLGGPSADLVRVRQRPPRWPAGFVGSLAHDDQVAVAAVGRAEQVAALGIDVEPAEPLPPGLTDVIATPSERRRYARSVLEGRDLLVAKEAVYKAAFSLDGLFLDYCDIEVDLDLGRAVTTTGRAVTLFLADAAHKIALAVIHRQATGAARREISSGSRS